MWIDGDAKCWMCRGVKVKAQERKAESLSEPPPKKQNEATKKLVLWIDETGEQIAITYDEASQTETDYLWERLANYAKSQGLVPVVGSKQLWGSGDNFVYSM